MDLREIVNRLVDVMPQPNLFPRTRLVYNSITTARRAREESAPAVDFDDALSAPDDLRNLITPKKLVKLSSGLIMSLEDQWAVIGTKGTGKTTFSLNLLNTMRVAWPSVGVNVLDSKPEKALRHLDTRFEQDEPPPPAPPGKMHVWAPSTNDPSAYDDWFAAILAQHGRDPDDTPSITYIDELSSIGANSPQSFPINFNRLMKQGRSNKKALIILSQEAAWIPRNVMGQASHLVRLMLLTEPDALRCDMLLHGSNKTRREPASRYGFWHRCLNAPGAAREYADWRELLS
jgi:hypothetical protein